MINYIHKEENQHQFCLLKSFILTILENKWTDKLFLQEENLSLSNKIFLSQQQEFDNSNYKIFCKEKLNEFLLFFHSPDPLSKAKTQIDEVKNNSQFPIEKIFASFSELTSVSYLRKACLLEILPNYSKAVGETLEIIKEIELFFNVLQEYTVKILLDLKSETFKEQGVNSQPPTTLPKYVTSEFFEVVLNNVGEGIVSYNLDGSIAFVNSNAMHYALSSPSNKTVNSFDQDKPSNNSSDVDFLLENLNKEGVLKDFQTEFVSNEGTKKSLIVNGKSVKNASGKTIGAVMVINDVTHHKEAETRLLSVIAELKEAQQKLELANADLEKKVQERTADLKESEIKYRFMAESIPAIVWTATPEGGLEYYSQKWTEYTGLTLEETRGWGWQIITHHEDLPNTIEAWNEAIKSGTEYKIEHRIKSKDDEYRWLLTRALPLKDQKGAVIKWFGTAIDIHDEKLWAEKLKESEESFRTLANNIPNLAWMANEDGYIFWYNQKWYEYTGTTPQDMEGWGWQSVHDPAILPNVIENWKVSLNTGKPFEMVFPLKSKDGFYKPFLTRVLPVQDERGNIIRWVGTNTDIKNERLREESLKMQSLVLESMNEGVSVCDENGNIVYTNAAEDRMFGYETKELLGKNILIQNALPPEETQQMMEVVRESLKNTGYWEGQLSNIKKDGSFFYSYAYISVLKLASRKLIICVQRDITEELAYKDALEYQSNLNKTITDNASSCLFLVNDQGYCTFMNPAGERMFGYTFQEIQKKPLHYMIHYYKQDGSLYEMEECPISKAFSARQTIRSHEDVFYKKDGSAFPVSCSASPIFENDTPLFTVIEVRDISVEKKANEELLDRNKELERINNDLDNFIYTASHDLKAPVSNIEGLLNAIKDSDHYEIEEIQPIIDMMCLSVDRFKKTINDLTDISKIQKAEAEDIEEINLEQLLEDVTFSIQSQILATEAHISLDFNSSPTIHFSKKNLRSILYNLISNAVKYHSPERKPEVLLKTEKIDGFVKLVVTDNGLGIRKESQPKLFSMFKRFHNHVDGTGVGLYIVKKIVENEGGKVGVESEEGVGTTFTLYLKQK